MQVLKVFNNIPTEFSRSTTALFLLILVAILYASFAQNQDCLLYSLDGASWRVLLHAQAADRVPFTQVGADPFQGSFDAYFPVYHEYLLPSALTLLFTGSPPDRVITYSLYGALLLFAAYTCARAIGFDRPTALLGAFLLPLLALPGLVHDTPTLYALFGVDPHASQIVSLSILIVTAFWALGGKARVKTVVVVFVPAICLLVGILGLVPFVVIMVPAIGIYGGASFLDARNWRDNVLRVAAGILMIVIPAALGMLQYLYGLVEYNAYNFFSNEFVQARGSLVFASSLFGFSPLGRLTVILGLIGAAWVALTESGFGRRRLFALAHIAGTILFLAVGSGVVLFLNSYAGVVPVYFETCIWPYMLIFTAVAIVTAVRKLIQGIMSVSNGHPIWVARHFDALVLGVIVASVAGYNGFKASQPDNYCPTQGFAPIRPTAITEIMKRTIGIEPGKRFNGLAATIDGVGGKPSVSWFDLYAHDAMLWAAIGNDLRTVGLWKYSIPTLFQYYTFITPPYYLLLTDFLARPQDQQSRSVVVLTRINEQMMRLWGVRFVITDTQPSIGVTRATLPVRNDETIRLIELNDVNVGDYSPTEVRQIADFRTGLSMLHEASFDGQTTVLSDVALNGTFLPARQSRLEYEKYGFHIHADSAGSSLLVLPVQYSHCWDVEGQGTPELFRADLMQLGVKFAGVLDARLVFRYGPLYAGTCRIEDYDDMKRLRIREARHTD